MRTSASLPRYDRRTAWATAVPISDIKGLFIPADRKVGAWRCLLKMLPCQSEQIGPNQGANRRKPGILAHPPSQSAVHHFRLPCEPVREVVQSMY